MDDSNLKTEIYEAIRQRVGEDDEEFIVELIQTYLQETTRYILEMSEAIATGNIDATRRVAHALKGSSANIGARTLQSLSAELEKQAKDNMPDSFKSYLERIKTGFEEMRAALEFE